MLKKKQDFYLILAWPLVAGFLCWFFSLNFAASTVIFYVIPAAYISWRIPGQISKSAVMSFIGMLIWSSLDYIWELTHAWDLNSISQFKFFGVISVEAPLWSFFWLYFIIIVYEYFFEKDRVTEKTKPLTKHLLLASLVGCGLFYVLIQYRPLLILPYSYLILGSLICVVPLIFVLLKYPVLRGKFLAAGSYFFYATFVYEVVGLNLNYWWFPSAGQFIGQISLLGIQFPIEEGILWILLGGVGVLSWYEFFDDDRK